MATKRGDFPFRSEWFGPGRSPARARFLLRTSVRFNPVVQTVFGDYFFGSGIQVVGWATGTSSDATTITLNLTSLTGGIATTALENDIVIVAHANRSAADRPVGVTTAGYTEVADLYANDDQDMNLSVSWKRMGSTPDTSVTTESPVLGRNAAVAYVLRGVDTTTALDVTRTTATGINSGVSDPPAITPTTEGSVVVAVTANMSRATAQLSGPFGYGFQAWAINTVAAPFPHLGIAIKGWQGGTEDPSAPTGHSDNIEDSWCAVTLALRPVQQTGVLTAAITEADDTVVATATVAVRGTASITEADDTVSATGTVGSAGVTGTASITEADDTVSSTATVAVRGTASMTEASDTVAATATVAVRGAAAITEAADTVAATATVSVRGTASMTEAADTVASTATVAVRGTASITEAADTVAATATVAVRATASITEADDTVAATAVVISGVVATLAVTEADDTVAATATVSGLEPPAPVTGGGGGPDEWWRSPPRKKGRKATTTDTGAPTEAPLSVSEDDQRAARLAEELIQARRRDAAAAAAQAETERLRLAALAAEDELVLLLAA